jgi:sporulation protein YlmC with PRC-barrel domain
MSDQSSFDLIRDLLDYEILDVDEVPCGRVDDVELQHTARGLTVSALLIGPGAWQARLPALLRVITRVLFGHEHVRVPIEEVQRIAEVISLRSRATELGLGRLDRRVGRWLARVPRT